MATPDLVIEGRSFAGFPILIGSDGWPVEPAQSFLWDVLIYAGTVESKLTWEAYGRWLYDFFAFLEANGLRWNADPAPLATSVVAKYRDWSLAETGVRPSTLNKRDSVSWSAFTSGANCRA